MSNNLKIWVVRCLDFSSVALPVFLGLVYIAISVVFRDFMGVPDAAEETKESNKLLLVGFVLVATALLLPLKSSKRFYISFGIATAAMWYGILPDGQEDQSLFFIVYAVSMPLLYLAKKKVNASAN